MSLASRELQRTGRKGRMTERDAPAADAAPPAPVVGRRLGGLGGRLVVGVVEPGVQ